MWLKLYHLLRPAHSSELFFALCIHYTVSCFRTVWLSSTSPKRSDDVTPFYETVSDCLTNEQRRAGIVGQVRTVELSRASVQSTSVKVEVGGEARNNSLESFRKIYQNKMWGNDKSNPQAASGELTLKVLVIKILIY